MRCQSDHATDEQKEINDNDILDIDAMSVPSAAPRAEVFSHFKKDTIDGNLLRNNKVCPYFNIHIQKECDPITCREHSNS
jgi:hypothetical protein